MSDGIKQSKRGGARANAGRKPKADKQAAPKSTGEAGPPQSTKWKPGQSGNPAGLPKHYRDVRSAAKELTTEAVERLAFWMRSDNAKASVSATVAILNRGWGMPQQNVKATVTHLRSMSDDELLGFLSGDDQGAGSEGIAAAPGDPPVTH
ncbi:MAG: hypothetical protein IT547_16915 [Hyphomonadaceae bacterium]|nr:hypothetical protein [Hyphomonadaceae bacterium]